MRGQIKRVLQLIEEGASISAATRQVGIEDGVSPSTVHTRYYAHQVSANAPEPK